jgi:hypothetical protein
MVLNTNSVGPFEALRDCVANLIMLLSGLLPSSSTAATMLMGAQTTLLCSLNCVCRHPAAAVGAVLLPLLLVILLLRLLCSCKPCALLNSTLGTLFSTACAPLNRVCTHRGK